MPPQVQVGDLDALLATLAADVTRESAERWRRGRAFAMAIAGGSVVVHGGLALSKVPFDWARTHIFWVDERAVPPSDPESNFREAMDRWLGPAHVPATSIHRMPADSSDLAGAAETYMQEILRVLAPGASLDYVLLGTGPDGHVASLFPGHPALKDEGLVLAVEDAPKPPPRRLTLGLSMFIRAERVVVMALGESKAAVVQEAMEADDSTLPLSLVLRRTRRPLVLLDYGAASLL